MKYFVYCRKSSEEKDRQIQSIESQQRELKTTFDGKVGIAIADWLDEEQSAMVPGRPIFGAMLDRIERGEADGIIAWAVDRLARNSVDAGRIIYLLDTGKLKDLKFPSYQFENTPAGKMMLGIFLSQSKYYSDALSENVKRGLRNKLLNGWLPGKAPIGYHNEKEQHTVISDPERLPLVREMWELMLAGAHTARDIRTIMAERGLVTWPTRLQGGRPLSLSGIYNVFSNPFYAGVIPWQGQLYPGKHEAVITLDEFESVQRQLKRGTQARSKTREFAFTGLIRCGECGLMVTAEEKINRFGSQYTYYHCTKKRLDYACRQPSVELRDLEKQITSFLEGITIAPKLQAFALEMAGKAGSEARHLREIEEKAISSAITRIDTARRNLLKVRIADQVGEAEFEGLRRELEQERLKLMERQQKATEPGRLEPEGMAVLFSIRGPKWFREGDHAEKRMIVEIAGSNPTLTDQKLKIDAVKLFRTWEEASSIPGLLAVVKDVRTLAAADEEVAGTITKLRSLFKKLRIDGVNDLQAAA